MKYDLRVGLWFEGSFTSKTRNLGILTNQLILNAGIDYTFNLEMVYMSHLNNY